MIECQMRAVCDKCGAEIEPMTSVKYTKIKETLWLWRSEWYRRGAMVGLPNRYGKWKLYCAKCADS